MAYDAEQKKVISAIIAGARKKFGGNRTLFKRAALAGIQTGLVERGLHNSGPVTDGTSEGWREETAASYPNVNRRDLHGSVGRFMSEIAGPLKSGQHSSEAAANVQRPAAQYRGRYAQNSKQAQDIFNAYAGKAISGGGKQKDLSSTGSTSVSLPTTQFDKAGFDSAQKKTILGNLIAGHNPNSMLVRLGVVTPGTLPSASSFISQGSRTVKVPGQKQEQQKSGGGGDAVKKNGIGNFEGHKVAAWIVPQLQYARAHGWKGPVTSGYRSHAYNVAQGRNYHSQHEETGYGKGAVDFGGMQDSAGLANRESFFRALRGYKGRTVQRPKGFRDDGHTSGTGG